MPQFEKIYRFNTIDASENTDWEYINPDGTTGLTSSSGSSKRKWNWDNNKTASSNVGPLEPEEGVGYIYTEASSPTKNNDKFIMRTINDIDASDENVELSFWYSADSDDDKVQLTVSIWNGNTWKKEYDQNIADTDPTWKQVEIDLTQYSNTDLRIEIKVNMKTGGDIWHKDIGIDTVRIVGGHTFNDKTQTTFFKTKNIKSNHKRHQKCFMNESYNSSEIKDIVDELEEKIESGEIVLDDDIIIKESENISHLVRKK